MAENKRVGDGNRKVVLVPDFCPAFAMRFDVFTLFPAYFEGPDDTGPLQSSMMRRGRQSGAIEIGVHDIRAWTTDRHHVCDDAPYGGGAGMVMKAEPVARALEDVLNLEAGPESSQQPPCPVLLMSPQGRPFSQRIAHELSEHPRLAILCGHYEGLDERAVELLVTDEISLGDYVLTGGEAAAIVIIDAVARLVPGVLGNEESAAGDSFADGLLEAPHYTRPVEWRGLRVPDVLLSGHHAEVEKWRAREGLRRTLQRRPDLLHGREHSLQEQAALEALRAEMGRQKKETEETRSNEERSEDESEFIARR